MTPWNTASICYRTTTFSGRATGSWSKFRAVWFPVIDRNPQKFVPNIFEAKESDFEAATQHVFRSKLHASSVILPVVR